VPGLAACRLLGSDARRRLAKYRAKDFTDGGVELPDDLCNESPVERWRDFAQTSEEAAEIVARMQFDDRLSLETLATRYKLGSDAVFALTVLQQLDTHQVGQVLVNVVIGGVRLTCCCWRVCVFVGGAATVV
jgi:hypothetical protein